MATTQETIDMPVTDEKLLEIKGHTYLTAYREKREKYNLLELEAHAEVETVIFSVRHQPCIICQLRPWLRQGKIKL